ncbi:MAG: hypothetical protein EB141_14270 [Verrucomicrobia bacterium]|nr:hypothetical protein [Verrucomicrobiota bacterium]NBU08028.1 hypothetical protein [Pseudomonadota bacterium]NDA68087.1 hypothetical protein [Verrucomicrobiota bacterium]NDB76782.1 hypothetical protein [Verrucomicrobiota bacterium]NDD38744.1 hypothetical protein [Verrucomicrobiota bacterium]
MHAVSLNNNFRPIDYMRLLILLVHFLAVVGAIAQANNAPLPKILIICDTNQVGPLTVIQTTADSFKVDLVKQQSVITNLTLICMTANRLSTKEEQHSVTLVLHGVTAYKPTDSPARYSRDQSLQTVMFEELSISLLKTELIQFNGEILSADSFLRKVRSIPKKR